MACCGPSIKRKDEKTLFDQLRGEREELSLNLNKIKMKFNAENGDWKSK